MNLSYLPSGIPISIILDYLYPLKIHRKYKRGSRGSIFLKICDLCNKVYKKELKVKIFGCYRAVVYCNNCNIGNYINTYKEYWYPNSLLLNNKVKIFIRELGFVIGKVIYLERRKNNIYLVCKYDNYKKYIKYI